MTIKIDNKALAIGVLSVTAAVLLAAMLMFDPQRAQAATAVRDRDYQMVTARLLVGGEGLYIVEQRTGLMAVFTWDAQKRTMEPRAVRAVADAFGPAVVKPK